jgi:tetratricopeptide (TPR) repeat protein
LGSLLKALGLTIWGLIAFGLLAIFIFIGYQAALKFRSASTTVADTHSTNVQSGGSPVYTHSDSDPGKQTTPESKNAGSASKPISLDATRKLFREAAEQHQYGTVLEYGKQLYDSGGAGAGDLVIIAHAFSSMRDCDNALAWVERANEAFQAAGREPDESLHRLRMRCESDNHGKNPPQLNTDDTKGKLADRFVRIGELYYGFGEYQHAINAIQRGLEIGRVSHLDDAYVYLGLSELAIKNNAEACKAFDKLEDVPDMSPRTLRLWKLFADTHC